MNITKELREWFKDRAFLGNGYAELTVIADRIDAVMEGMVELPKDADGVPIHVGDELAGYSYPNGGAYCKAIVGEWGILVGEQNCNYPRWLLWSAESVRHYHAPTVEDMLEEFVARWMETHHDDIPALKAEYAAKLQFKED